MGIRRGEGERALDMIYGVKFRYRDLVFNGLVSH